MKRALYVCLITPTQSTFFGFCLQVFRQAGPPQRVDFLAPMGSRRKVFSPTTHCQFENRTRAQQLFNHLPDPLPLSYRRRRLAIVEIQTHA